MSRLSRLARGARGPTHRYIGASPACWNLYTTLLASGVGGGRHAALVVDAYAAQHPGDDSPQATQSVATHLVTLEAVLTHGHPVDRTVPIRAAAVEYGRRTGGYPKLEPVPPAWPSTLAAAAGDPDAMDGWVEGVLQTWKERHGPVVDGWYRATLDLARF